MIAQCLDAPGPSRRQYLSVVASDGRTEDSRLDHIDRIQNVVFSSGYAFEHAIGGTVAYHIRHGGHDVTAYDWQQYLAFSDRNIVRPR